MTESSSRECLLDVIYRASNLLDARVLFGCDLRVKMDRQHGASMRARRRRFAKPLHWSAWRGKLVFHEWLSSV